MTWTTRLPANAVLYALAPPRLPGEPGRPCLKGLRLGTPADLAAAATWRTVPVRIYGRSHRSDLAARTCLWVRLPAHPHRPGHPGPQPRRRPGPGHHRPGHPAARLIERYAARWSIEQAFEIGYPYAHISCSGARAVTGGEHGGRLTLGGSWLLKRTLWSPPPDPGRAGTTVACQRPRGA